MKKRLYFVILSGKFRALMTTTEWFYLKKCLPKSSQINIYSCRFFVSQHSRLLCKFDEIKIHFQSLRSQTVFAHVRRESFEWISHSMWEWESKHELVLLLSFLNFPSLLVLLLLYRSKSRHMFFTRLCRQVEMLKCHSCCLYWPHRVLALTLNLLWKIWKMSFRRE